MTGGKDRSEISSNIYRAATKYRSHNQSQVLHNNKDKGALSGQKREGKKGANPGVADLDDEVDEGDPVKDGPLRRGHVTAVPSARPLL